MRIKEPLLIAYVLVIGILALLVVYPLIMLLINSFQTSSPGDPVRWSLEGYATAYSQPAIAKAFSVTFGLGLIRTIISMVLAVMLSWLIVRTDMPYRDTLEILIWMSFMLPLLPMTLGWITLLDPDYGLLNTFFAKIPLVGQYLHFNIYSYGGMIWAHIASSTAYRVLYFTPAFRNMDAALEEAGLVSGASSWKVLWRITFPALLPAIAGATLLGFIKSMESFEVEVLLGWPAEIYVFTSLIYKYLQWTEPAQYASATAMSVIFIAMIGLLIWLNRYITVRRQYTTVTGKGFHTRSIQLGRAKYFCLAACLLYLAVFVALPMGVLILGSFMKVSGLFNVPQPYTVAHWVSAFGDPVLLEATRNSLYLGLATAVLAPFLFLIMGYLAYRSKLRWRGAIDIITWLPWSVPGILLGVALLWAVLGPLTMLRFMYGTLGILVLAMLVKEMPFGMRIMNGTMIQISPELEESAMVCGATLKTIFRKILIPILVPSLIAIAVLTFLAALRDVSTVVLLSSPKSWVLSVMMLSNSMAGMRESAQIIGVFITFLVVLVAVAGRKLGMKIGPKR